MISFLKLTRPINLLIIAFTMYAMRYWVIEALISSFGFELQLSRLFFALLVLSVVCIAAAGNVINDYFDTKTDTINKPDHVIVGFAVTRRIAMTGHLILNAIGILLGIILAYKVGNLAFALVHFFAAGLLWYYSTLFKRKLIWGNFVVALLAALVPLTVGLYEIPLIEQYYKEEAFIYLAGSGLAADTYFKVLFMWIIGFSVFAFLLNFIREIQKDLADIKGDAESGRATLPLVAGIHTSKLLIIGLVILTLSLLIYVYNTFIGHKPSLFYFLIAIVMPLSGSALQTFRASDRQGFVLAGNITKAVMLAGVCYSLLIANVLSE